MRKLALLFLAFCIASAAVAQVTTSSMSGKVTDQGGQGLVGATVVAVHTPSGTQYGTVVDVNGNYRILNMRPGGPYTVTVQILGYQTSEYPGIELALGDNYVLNSSLSEAALGMDEIVVRGTGVDNMNTDRAGAITSVNARKIANQPTVSRSLNDIIRLSPQSSATSNGTAIGGGNYRQSYVTVDGAAFNNMFGIGQNLPASGSPISLDALEQISISVTPYDVRQSGFTGGSINAVTRSGDNEFRGSAYSYINSEKFRGNKTSAGEFDKDESKYRMYGFRFGGPIIQDKLFFFVNGEIERETSPGPAARARKSESEEFGSNNINRPTEAKLDEIRNYLISKYDYDPGAYQNYSNKAPAHKILARIDWNINDDHKLNVRYSRTKSKYNASPSSSVSPLSAGTIYPAGQNNGRGSTYAMYFKNSRYYQEQNFNSVAAELNSKFGNVHNTLRYTFSHQDEPRSWDGKAFPTVDILEEGSVYTTFGLDPFTYGNLREVKSHIITDEVNWGIGRNNFTAGLQFETNDTKNGYMQGGAGYYVYKSWDDFVDGNRPSAFALTHTNNSDFSQAYPSFKYNQFSVYLQDKIDVSDNFKVTAGIRLEIPMYPELKNNYNKDFARLVFDGKSYSTDQMPKAKAQVSPRVGFNWDITGDRRHVLRGGTGLFTGRIPFVWIVSAAANSNMLQTQLIYNTVTDADNVPGFHANLDDILKDIYGGFFQFDPDKVVAPTRPTIIDKKLKLPSTWKTSLAYDVRLPGGILGTLEGIFNKDYNSVYVRNIGLKDPTTGGLKMSANDNRDLYNNGYWAQNSAEKPANVQPYLITNSDKNGWYYSFTAKLEKNFLFGLSAMVAYTRSDNRSLGDGIGDQVTSAWTNVATLNGNNDPGLSWGSYVSPNRLIASIGYNKEYGRNFGTTVALFYEGSHLGYMKGTSYSYTRYSYTYTASVVGDGGSANLLYVPKTKDELTFTDVTAKDNVTVTYSAAQQAEDFWAYVNQDKYLKDRKGQYVKRNGVLMPWYSRFDFKIMQDFFVNTASGKRNTLQVGLDIQNVGNLLNKKWGNVKQVNRNALLKIAMEKKADGTDSNTPILNANGERTYQFQKDGSATLSKTYSKYERFASTYFMQLSLRYTFN